MIVFPHGFLTTQAEAPSEAFENTYSVEFDGVNDFILVPDSTSLDITGAFSISAWVKSDGGSDEVLISKEGFPVSGDFKRGWALWSDGYWTDSGVTLYIWNGSSLSSVVTGSPLTTGEWSHVVAVYEPSTSIKIYVNGSLSATNTTSIPASINSTTADIAIGRWTTAYGTSYPFGGNIDELGIWNVSLDSDAVTALYNSGSPIDLSSDSGDYDNSSNLQGWWRMGDGANYPIIKNQAHFSQTALDFDGSNDYVTMGNVLPFERDEAFSISAWVYLTSTSTSTYFAITGKYQNSGNYSGYQLYAYNNKLHFILRGNSSMVGNSDTNLTANTWHHVVGTYDGSDTSSGIKTYINGSLDVLSQAGSTGTSILSNTPYNIGSRAGGSLPFQGNIDDVSVYSTELSSSDVTDIYNSGHPKDESERSGLVGYWKMGDGDTYPTLTDNSTNSNDGTMTNMDSGDFGAAKGAGTMTNMASDDIVEDTP